MLHDWWTITERELWSGQNLEESKIVGMRNGEQLHALVKEVLNGFFVNFIFFFVNIWHLKFLTVDTTQELYPIKKATVRKLDHHKTNNIRFAFQFSYTWRLLSHRLSVIYKAACMFGPERLPECSHQDRWWWVIWNSSIGNPCSSIRVRCTWI